MPQVGLPESSVLRVNRLRRKVRVVAIQNQRLPDRRAAATRVPVIVDHVLRLRPNGMPLFPELAISLRVQVESAVGESLLQPTYNAA